MIFFTARRISLILQQCKTGFKKELIKIAVVDVGAFEQFWIFSSYLPWSHRKRKPNPIGIKNHFFVIQNLSNTVTVTNIRKTNMVWNTRGTVTIVFYRRWSVNAKSRSIDTVAKMRKETPVVVQPDRNWTIFNSQNTAKFSSSSAILWTA